MNLFPTRAWHLLLILVLILQLVSACGTSSLEESSGISSSNQVTPVAQTPTPVPTDGPIDPAAMPTRTVLTVGDLLTLATSTVPPTAPPSATLAQPAATSTAVSVPLPTIAAAPLPPNELGSVLVLEYHLIEAGEDTIYNRTPQSLAADLEWLYTNNYYPIRFRDVTENSIDIPAGKSPVVLTFDDSSAAQFRILADGSVDPTSAMGIIFDFAERHADFPPVVTVFPLLDVDVPSRILWGQPEFANRKLQMIVELGGEVGSHSVSHERFDLVSEERIVWQLAHSSKWLADRIGGGYEVRSLGLPYGEYPSNETLLYSGESEGIRYAYSGAAEAVGGPALSPFSTKHDPYHVRRTQAVPGYFENIQELLENRATLRFVSDGDPQTITIPSKETLDEEQRGTFVESEWPTYQVIRYEREN